MARSLVSGGIGLHLVPFFIDLGASSVTAAVLAGSVGLMSIPGRFGLSALGDYVNKRYVMVASLALMSVSIVFMARAPSVAAVIPILVAFSALREFSVIRIPECRYSELRINGCRISHAQIRCLGILSDHHQRIRLRSPAAYTIASISFSGAH